VPTFDRFCLMPFALPDFVRNRKQLIGTLRTGKQTAVVIGESDVAGFDQEVTETSGAQR
jgi:hypothetical protein